MTKRGFTLLEVLLAVALIGLLATALIGVSANMLADKPSSPDDVFWQAAQESRKTALKSGLEVQLSFDDKAKAFVASNGTTTKTIAVPKAGNELGVDFLSSQSGGSAILVGGTLMETQTAAYVTFYPDGTCVPFRVQIRTQGGAHKLDIDPWTCAPVLPQLDASGAPIRQ